MLGRRDVVVAGEHDRRAGLSQRSGVEAQPLEPGELVVEFRAGLRVAVGRIDAGDEDAVDGGLDVAGLDVGSVAGQGGAGEDRLDTAREDGDAVPGALALPDGMVAGTGEVGCREALLVGLQLLQAGDVGLTLAEPFEKVRQPAVDVVDVEGGDDHGLSLARPSTPPRSNVPTP